MKKTNEMHEVLKMVQSMSERERSAIAEQIMQMMAQPQVEGSKGFQELLNHPDEKPDCPYCGAKADFGYVIKKGFIKGKQRYQCKHCGRYFMPTTGTAFARTRKDADTWRKYIQMTISGASLNACMEECDISYQIAFNWRHKVMNAFEVNLKATKMTGNVEVDEMLIPLSYKGNHVQGGFGVRRRHTGLINDMPRRSYKRGTDNLSRSSKDKACIFCMVQDGNKAFYAAVPGVGFMNNDMLNATIGRHVDKDAATLLADRYKTTHKYCEDNGYKHVILKSNTSDKPHGHKPEVKDGLHIQHVNTMHHHIRQFLTPYCGVSSKYLSNYIALFVWLKNIQATKQRKTIEKVSLARVASTDCYITSRAILSRPAVPQCG